MDNWRIIGGYWMILDDDISNITVILVVAETGGVDANRRVLVG